MIVNNTSISSVSLTPHNSVYHASKAAAAMFSDHQRFEMESFGIRVVDLKTGCVHTNFHNNRSDDAKLPLGSICGPVKELTERAMDAKHFSNRTDLEECSNLVVDDLLRQNPPPQVWRGKEAGWTWLGLGSQLPGSTKHCKGWLGLICWLKNLRRKAEFSLSESP